MPENTTASSKESSPSKVVNTRRNLDHLAEQQFLNAMSPTASKARSAQSSRDESPRTDTDSGRPPVTKVYEYVPFKILDRRNVLYVALGVMTELKYGY
jgi:hypothetical protein